MWGLECGGRPREIARQGGDAQTGLFLRLGTLCTSAAHRHALCCRSLAAATTLPTLPPPLSSPPPPPLRLPPWPFRPPKCTKPHLVPTVSHQPVLRAGQEEIEATCFACAERLEQMRANGQKIPDLLILPIYSQLPGDLQVRAERSGAEPSGACWPACRTPPHPFLPFSPKTLQLPPVGKNVVFVCICRCLSRP